MTFKTTRKTVQNGNSVGLTFPSIWGIKTGSLVNVAVHKTEVESAPVYEATLKVCSRGHVDGVHLPLSWGFQVGDMVTAEVEPMEMPFDGSDA